MLLSIRLDETFNGDQSSICNCPAPHWLDAFEETGVAAAFVDVLFEHLFADDRLDPVAADEQVACCGGPVFKVQCEGTLCGGVGRIRQQPLAKMGYAVGQVTD